MNAIDCTDMQSIRFPVLATPKADGVRCLVVYRDGKKQVLSKKFKPIPNRYVRRMLEEHLPPGFDGELLLNGVSEFSKVSSAIMSQDGEPDFYYGTFDFVEDIDAPYQKRMDMMMRRIILSEHNWNDKFNVEPILPVEITSVSHLQEFERYCLDKGYEGVIVRSPNGPYKCGKSTLNEGYALKIKRFVDSEAVIVSFNERMHNANPMEYDAFGLAKRSHKKDGMVPMGTLGSLVVKDIKTGVTCKIGTGFDADTAKVLWNARATLVGKIIKYKYQPTGVKDKPRFPVYLGIRSKIESAAIEGKEKGTSMEFDS